MDVVIGVGGAGGWLCTLRAKSPNNPPMTLIDGDLVSKANLSRQFYTVLDINKAKVVRMREFLQKAGLTVHSEPVYLNSLEGDPLWDRLIGMEDSLRVFSMPDNHPARVACMELADGRGQKPTAVVLCGNEYTTASADIYFSAWRDTPLDFRVRYPEVTTDVSGDPLRPSCTGQAVEASPQLALYNSLGALSAAWLMDLWTLELPSYKGSELYDRIRDKTPVSIQWTATGLKTIKLEELRSTNDQSNS